MSEFDKLVDKTREEIRMMLKNPDKRPYYMSHDQLSDVQSEICRMARIKDPEKFYPYYPKGMADACWLPDNSLVIKLNKILEMYVNKDFGVNS